MISACVVDTDVLSFVFKGSAKAQVYGQHLTNRSLILSFMSVAELDLWALQRSWGANRIVAMEAFLKSFTIVSWDRVLCRTWAQVIDSERRQGRVVGVADAWVAATALTYMIPLVTHNRRHFESIRGLQVISEG